MYVVYIYKHCGLPGLQWDSVRMRTIIIVNFIPIVAETLGGLGEETINIIGAIGNAIDGRVTMTHSTSSTKKYLFHCLAIALWRGNACLCMASSSTNFTSFSGWYPLNCMPPPSYLLVCCFCTFVLFDIT